LLHVYRIDRTGRVDPTHAALYKKLGDWIKTCYGTPVASSAVVKAEGSIWTVEIDTGTTAVDRVMIQENQTLGQRILSYRVVDASSGAVLTHGQSVGNKRIDFFLIAPKNASAGACDFPTDLGNHQCLGLTHQGTKIATLAECKATCCAEGASCGTYQWCQPNTGCSPAGCWMGSTANCVAGKPGWISKARGMPGPAVASGKLRLEILATALGLAPLLEGFGAFKACSSGP
jgi:hypothetical protein